MLGTERALLYDRCTAASLEFHPCAAFFAWEHSRIFFPPHPDHDPYPHNYLNTLTL